MGLFIIGCVGIFGECDSTCVIARHCGFPEHHIDFSAAELWFPLLGAGNFKVFLSLQGSWSR